MTVVMVPILPNNRVPHRRTIRYMPDSEALTTHFPSRACFAAYSRPDHPHRLTNDDVGVIGDIPIRLFLLDVDDEDAHKADKPSLPEWRATEREKIKALLAERPGGFFYFTRRGWRGVYRLATPFVLRNAHDVEVWRASYLAELENLSARFGIVADPSGSRWSQLFDLPHTSRDA